MEIERGKEDSLKEENRIWVKIVLAGDSKVGKTTLAKAIAGVNREHTELTIGVDFVIKRLENTIIYFSIFDLGGHHRFEKLRDLYYTGALAIGLMFDLSNPDSLKDLLKWAEEIKKAKETAKGNLYEEVVLIGNKSDLIQRVSDKKIESIIKVLEEGYGIRVSAYIKTSALYGDGVEEAFWELVKVALKNLANRIGVQSTQEK
ncbi:MAG: Rab family GTPase [Candidatus Njordarchaeia archaeon]